MTHPAAACHVEGQELLRFLDQLPDQSIALLAHAVDCDLCRSQLRDRLSAEGLEADPWHAVARAGSLFSATIDRQDRVEGERRAEKRQASTLAADLLRQPDDRWVEIIEGDGRFISASVAELLLEAAAHERSPARAEALARLALRITHRLGPPRVGTLLLDELVGNAWCQIGEARRLRDDLEGAEAAYGKALESLDSLPVNAPVRAEYCRLLARLRTAQGRIDEALSLQRRAAALFAGLRDRSRLGLTLGDEGRLLFEEGESVAALGHLSEAVSLVSFTAWPWEAVRVRLSLALALADWNPEVAQRHLATGPSVESIPPGTDRARLRWEEARVQAKLKLPQAVEAFSAAIDELTLTVPFEAGQAALELTEILVEGEQEPDDRQNALARLRNQVATISASRSVHCRARTVLAVALEMAAEHAEAAATFLIEASAYLARARYSPSAGWQVRGSLYWDDLDIDHRSLSCKDAGLSADLAEKPAATLTASERERLSWSSAVRAGLAIRFDATAE